MPVWLQLGVPWWELVLRACVIYVAFLLGLRLFGKREIGQFTVFDFVLILLIANALQPAMTGPDVSLTGGLILLVSFFLINRAVALLRSRIPFVDRLITPQATVIARDGEWIQANVEKEGLNVEDCDMALREHGIEKVDDVRLAELEEDGSISVVPKDQAGFRRRRRVRFKRA